MYSLLYFAYTCVRDVFIGGGGDFSCKKDYKVMVFTCKKPENIICDDVSYILDPKFYIACCF